MPFRQHTSRYTVLLQTTLVMTLLSVSLANTVGLCTRLAEVALALSTACEGVHAGEITGAGEQSNAQQGSRLKLCGQAMAFLILQLLHSTSLLGVLSIR